MLTETKVKYSEEIDGRIRKKSIIYLTDSETLIDALGVTVSLLEQLQASNQIEDADIISCKRSSIKEVADRFDTGERAYVAVLKDLWVDEVSGEEKSLRYKVLLHADDLTQCNTRVQELSREGYDMQVESLTEMNIEYISTSIITS